MIRKNFQYWIKNEIRQCAPSTISQLIVRLDGGYWSPELLKEIDLPWLIHCPKLKCLKLDDLIKDKNTKWQKYSKATEFIDLGRKDLGNAITARVIFVKQLERSQKIFSKKNKKYIYYPLATTLTHWSAHCVIKAYRGRQVIENHFKETNQAFFSNKLPSGKLRANEAFLWFVTFAYTISVFFKRSSFANLLKSNELQKLPT